ncbi:hypothetical protein POJ06DRAFT_273352 [Lipomyces tetrasporus]|uniref:Uncharacterized protein n=1 Tax=Lipomyces tetrasporus TaxID=54092 RepID=A0AAD7QXI9_9ASCO|nr:uncharacterized protein POJ06DRAFT_273352 [Lipomyces tetrasporus]KAJ8102741.1 hypothetical protein POJ06DRAFT_273352 [Lipomyces tetrasporus]
MGFSSHLLSPMCRAIFSSIPAIVFTACCMELLYIRQTSRLRELLSAALDAYMEAYLPRILTTSQIQQRRAQLLAEIDARRLRADAHVQDPDIAVQIYTYLDTTAVGDRDEQLENFFVPGDDDRSILGFVRLLKHARPWKTRV